MVRTVFVSCCVAAGLAGPAGAAFVSSFDSFISGQTLHNLDGWKGWDNAAGVAGTVSSARSFSGSNALQIGPGRTDAVREIAGASAGVWNLIAMQYLAGGQSGSTYVILMNRYLDGQNDNSDFWSVQLRFDLAAGTVVDDLRGGSAALVFDAWVPIQIQIDLTANTVSQYYNNMLIASGTWTRGAASQRSFQAVNLYSDGGNAAFYDDVQAQPAASAMIPAPGVMALAALTLLVPRRRR